MKNFLIELSVRFFKDKPQFFVIIQSIALGLGAVSAGFAFVDSSHTVLPAWLMWLEKHEVWLCSLIAAIIAQLPNKDINTKP
jgi:hypothetical protein